MERSKNNDLKESLMRDFPKLICPFDLKEMSCEKIRWVQSSKNKSKFLIPLYKCKICGRRYTTLNQYDYMESIRFNNNKYLNLKYGYVKRPCYVYGVVKATKCRATGCHDHKLITKVSSKGKLQHMKYKFCPKCGTIYISCAEYDANRPFFECINTDELPNLREAVQKKAAEKRRKKEEKKRRQEVNIEKRRQEALDIERRKQEALSIEGLQEALILWRERQEQKEKNREEQLRQEQKEKNNKKVYTHDNTIRVKDFVVRRNVFKCRHHDHRLRNINAVISIINSAGKVLQCTVPAGYCPNCNIFFIMESTYKNLKRKGVLLCRVSDEKKYLKGHTLANGMKLAQQSILMQYGYSVAQGADLTSAQRRKILASIINNGILTKSEVISYLDFFINQHQHQQKNKFAIAKWESDRDFVSSYNKQKYKTFGVRWSYVKFSYNLN